MPPFVALPNSPADPFAMQGAQAMGGAVGGIMSMIMGIKRAHDDKVFNTKLADMLLKSTNQGDNNKDSEDMMGLMRQYPRSAEKSPLIQHLMAGRAGQIFRTPDDIEKSALDLQGKRQNNLSSMLYNRAMASADNSGLNIPDFNNLDYTRPESIFNPSPNQENGNDMMIAGKGRLIPRKTIDAEKRAADIDWKRSQTEKNRREIVKPPSVSLQEWDMLTDEEKADRARVKAGLKPKAISPEEQEYKVLRNNKLKYEEAWRTETDPIKKKTMEKNLALIGEKLDSFGQTSEKDIWAEYAKLTNRKITTKKADGSTETRMIVPSDAEINSFNESFADSGVRLVKKMTKAGIPERSEPGKIWGVNTTPAVSPEYEYVLEDVGGADPAGQAEPITAGKIKVVAPDGRLGYIPESQLQEAIDEGYREAE